MPRRATGKRAGRPAHDPIVMRARKIVPLDDEEREAAVRILIELLDEWLGRKTKREQKVAV